MQVFHSVRICGERIKGRKLENNHILSWCRIQLLYFVRNYVLTSLFSLLRNSFHCYQLPWKNWVPRAVYDCPLGWRRKCNRSRVWKLHVPGPMKFCQICQLTNFYFHQLSKVFMTVLHQNMTNDNAPPKYDNWPCSTKIWEMTVIHQNLRKDRAPPKNPNFLFSSAL